MCTGILFMLFGNNERKVTDNAKHFTKQNSFIENQGGKFALIIFIAQKCETSVTIILNH